MHTGNHPEDGQTGMIVPPYVASSDNHHCQTKDLCDHRCLSGRQRGKGSAQYRTGFAQYRKWLSTLDPSNAQPVQRKPPCIFCK